MKISKITEIQNIFETVKRFAQAVPYNTHHLDHIYRVYKLSAKIASIEKADYMIVAAASLMHDLGRFFEDSQDNHELISSQKAADILHDMQWPCETIQKVCYAIETHRFSQGLIPETLEAKIIQDADKLDALGAIGAIRVVAYDNKKPLYDVEAIFSCEQAPNKKFTLDHFFEKIFRLPEHLHTDTAKEIAKRRFLFTKSFIRQLEQEINF